MTALRPDLNSVLAVMSRKSYRIYHNDLQPFDLNIVGIRTASLIPHTFDDWVTVFYRSHRRWIFNAFPATTDPGLFWLGTPMNPLGAAILKEGQYPAAYALGKHKGYKALVQKGALTVIRDFDLDDRLTFGSGREETGSHFGINVHRASEHRESLNVDKWSAGCQVLCDPLQFNYFIEVCEKAANAFGNTFTYTLLHERDFS